MMKRSLAFVLSMALIFGNLNAVPVFAASDDGTEIPIEQEIEIEDPEEEIEEAVPEDDGLDTDGSIVLEEELPETEILPTAFMDPAFLDYIMERFDINGDGLLSIEEAGTVTYIDVSAMGITDFGGIEYFTNLEYLNCADNELESLDLSANVQLLHLDCHNNRITVLDLSENILLETLDCSGNRLTSLDTSANTEIIGDDDISIDQEPGESAEEGEDIIIEDTEEPEILKDPSDPVELGGVFYPSLEEAFKHLDATAPNFIILHEDIAPARFSLPTGISELTIMSDGTTRTITLPKTTSLAPSFKFDLDNVNIVSAGASSLTINAKQDFNLTKVSFTPVTNISVAAKHEIIMQGAINGIGKLSGTSTSKLTIYESTEVSEIANFDKVWITSTDPVKVSGKVSGITTLDGKLRMLSADKANTAVIKNAQGTLSLAYNNGAVTKATVTEIPGLLRIEVYDEGTDTPTKLPSGIPILTAGGTADLTDHLWIDNKDSANHTLNAYAYNREIRAEFSGALTLNDTDYPNFEKAFENLVENSENTITLHTDLAPAKFALPTKKIKKLSIIGDGTYDYDKRKITLPKVTSLAPAYELFIKKVDFYNPGVTSFAINAKADIDLENVDFFPNANISVPADHSITLAGRYCTGIGKVSGTNRSSLIVQDDVFVGEVANFKRLSVTAGKTFSVYGKVSGIDTLEKGILRLGTLGTPTASVIKTVDNAELILDYDEAGKTVLSKVTVTNVTGTLMIKAIDVNDSSKVSTLPSGTPILTAGGKTDFTERIMISENNKDTDGNPLDPYLYNKEIRAEYAGALTLTTASGSKNYPNFEKAFENLSATGNNTINLHTDLAPAKFTFPTKIEKLTIKSDNVGIRRTITLPKIKSLTPTFTLELQDVNIESNDVTTFTINAKKDLRLSDTYFAPFVNISAAADVSVNLNAGTYGIDKLSGTKSSNLYVGDDIVVYKDVETFGYLFVYPGSTLKVMGKISGIEKLKGDLWLASAGETDTAAIKTVDTAMLILDYDPAKQALLSKVTVTDVDTELKVAVVDYLTDGSTLCALPSGLPILTAGSDNDFTGEIKIENKTGQTTIGEYKTLSAKRYGKEM
ncbi:MAG: hypothetical protein K6F53_03730, partial [Lachnospiraceae bacterium]|nr:hypothetical protein [Lachnospiraceae bacterium]